MYAGGQSTLHERLRGEMCTGKVAFESRSLAARVGKRRTRKGRACEPFRCVHYRLWHLGTPKPGKRP
jgi:hypothetical protein